MYTLTSAALAADAQSILRSDGAYIPPDPANSDFAAYLAWLAVGNAPTPYAPPPPPVPSQVTRKQFFQAAAQTQIITQDEALAVLATGTVPTRLGAAIATLPVPEQFAAKMAILGDPVFYRTDAKLSALGTAIGKSSADIDDLFTLAATL
ncbi:hypothetical protein M2323_001205 [Rhodoblastus acidophilus]|uniref:hypothetical protein n=1 Tax=Rhodoblastus acidophilus TaxID=1074 RepID=UPI00222514C5|nr:hypothetical protein [Rhodoblastus acidophilus]MCW2283381.1 hypothetical protein [Rhodoblastus acidophilus]MCW2332295.1 hypothetical protein [Rhodoblastus acidophilus]